MKNRMTETGRNDVCPCGSGKKYKKCCLPQEEEELREFIHGSTLNTKTILDEYAFLFRGIVLYGQGQIGDGPYARVLRSEYERFEQHYNPGPDSDISDGLFIPWFYLDYRHGKEQKTLAECFIEEGYSKKLMSPGPQLIQQLTDSYCTFYQIKEVLEKYLILTEPGTGNHWRASRAGEAPEQTPVVGEFWYTRLVGTAEESYFFMAPYVYLPEEGAWIQGVIEENKKNFGRYCGVNAADFTQKEFRDTCKATVQFWAGIFSGDPLPTRKMEAEAQMPQLSNTDSEPLRFSKIFFKILVREGLEGKLSSLSNIEFNPEGQQWIWSRKGNRRMKNFSTTTLGSLSVEGSYLVGETNSLERALKLKSKLRHNCKSWLAYEKIESRDFASMPSLTKAETEKFDCEQTELNKNPEVRKFMKQQAEDYYYKEWIRTKVLVLGNKTPLQAAKTVSGRVRLRALLRDFEERQKRQDPEDPFRFDINELRRRLGLV